MIIFSGLDYYWIRTTVVHILPIYIYIYILVNYRQGLIGDFFWPKKYESNCILWVSNVTFNVLFCLLSYMTNTAMVLNMWLAHEENV